MYLHPWNAGGEINRQTSQLRLYSDEIVRCRFPLCPAASRGNRADHVGQTAEAESCGKGGSGSDTSSSRGSAFGDPCRIHGGLFQAWCREGDHYAASAKSTRGSDKEINGIIPERTRLIVEFGLLTKFAAAVSLQPAIYGKHQISRQTCAPNREPFTQKS